METPPTNSATQVLAPLGGAFVAVTDRLDWSTPAEVSAVVDVAPRLRSQLDAMQALAMAAGERAGVQKQQRYDYNTMVQMMADRTGADPFELRALLRLGRWVVEFTDLVAAWTAGDLLTEHVELLRRKADCSRTHRALLRDQPLFVDFAADYDFVDFGHCVQYWVNCNDPDGAEPKEQTAKTFFRARKDSDGSVKISGYLDPLTGAAFMTALERELQKQFRSKKDVGDQTPSLGRQGADALMALILKGSANTAGVIHQPLIHIVMSQSVAEDMLRRLTEPPLAPLPLAFDDIDKRCELIDGTPIHPDYVMQIMGIATFRRQIMTAAGEAFDVSVKARCFTPLQKQIIKVQARGRCRKRGCDNPFAWLEADHVVPHSRGGPTQVSNAQPLCSPDNKAKRDKPAA